MAVIIAIAVYLFQILCICVIAAVIGFVIKSLLSLMNFKTSNRTAIILLAVIFVTICVVLAYFCGNPIVTCPDEYSDIITDEQLRNMQSIASGVYSKRLPLVPVRVNIKEVHWVEMFDEYEIKFRIDYLFFGNVEMVAGGDGISVVKPLIGR